MQIPSVPDISNEGHCYAGEHKDYNTLPKRSSAANSDVFLRLGKFFPASSQVHLSRFRLAHQRCQKVRNHCIL